MSGRSGGVGKVAGSPSRAVLATLVVASFTPGCTPTFDWREVHDADAALTLSWPCRPSNFARPIELGGRVTTWTLKTCQAGGMTWALGHGLLSDPAAVPTALRELRGASQRAVHAGELVPQRWSARGFTPHTEAGRWAWQGRLGDGREVAGVTLVFAQGLRAYQATVVGARLDAEQVTYFIDALRPAR